MERSRILVTSLLFGALLGLLSGPACAGAKNVQGKTVALQEVHVWYDGQQERQVWLNPDLIAEFPANTGNAAKSAVNSVFPNAVQVPVRRGSVRLWQVGQGATADAAVRAMSSANRTDKYSPVLHEGPTLKGRKRALPGNIIVYLDPAWTSDAVNAWVAGCHLEIIKKLEIGPNVYVIKTGPGLEALNTANSLYKSGEVVAAFPDWWVETTTR